MALLFNFINFTANRLFENNRLIAITLKTIVCLTADLSKHKLSLEEIASQRFEAIK